MIQSQIYVGDHGNYFFFFPPSAKHVPQINKFSCSLCCVKEAKASGLAGQQEARKPEKSEHAIDIEKVFMLSAITNDITTFLDPKGQGIIRSRGISRRTM